MFRRRTNSVNDLKRKWMCILFLVLFVSAGFSLTGLSQSQINNIKNSPAPIQIEQLDDDEYEYEETIEFKEMVEIHKLPETKLLMTY